MMNKNFKKLLEQSYSKAFEECIQRGHQVKQIDAIFNSIVMDEFARLIVRECVKFCEHESNDDEHDEYDMGMWVKAESIKTAIMEEFGIKE